MGNRGLITIQGVDIVISKITYVGQIKQTSSGNNTNVNGYKFIVGIIGGRLEFPFMKVANKNAEGVAYNERELIVRAIRKHNKKRWWR